MFTTPTQMGIVWSILLLALAMTAFCVPAYPQASSELEFDWTFDVQDDYSTHVDATITIHPHAGTWSYTTMSFYESDHVSGFKAYDYATGNSLVVSVSTSTGTKSKSTYRVNFPHGESDGYRCKVQFHVSDLVAVTGTVRSISWGWGGIDSPLPQRVQVQLPANYIVQSVTSNNQHVDYANSVGQGRVVVSFQGVAPSQGYFEWKLAMIQGTATTRTTVYWYTTVVSTYTTSALPGQTLGLIAAGSGLGFVLAYPILRRRVGHKPKRVTIETVVCVSCRSENPTANLHCGRCGSALDATRIYDDRSR